LLQLKSFENYFTRDEIFKPEVVTRLIFFLKIIGLLQKNKALTFEGQGFIK